jgi:MFS transporter, SP family, general alpha glucoside:H+ symporter
MGPTCYPIVAETPSGRLRYKTIAIGRFAYNIVSIIQNIITPRMLSPTGKIPWRNNTADSMLVQC